MKRKIVPHLITAIAAVTLLVLGIASTATTTTGKTKEADVTWNEGMTIGVTRITNDNIAKNWVRVSPDGTKILYTEAAPSGNLQIVYLRDANNPAKTPLIGEIAWQPSWYEDSNRFIYVSYESGAGRLVRSNVSGGGKTYISRAPIGQNGDAVPSVKNGIIAFTAIENNRYTIATVKENGTEATFLVEGRSPSWHPEENKIVYIKNEKDPFNYGGDIYELDPQTGQFSQIYSDPKYYCYEPSYSPDGKKILFAKGTAVRATGTNSKTTVSYEITKRHIFIMNADGTNVSPVSSGNATVTSPSWGLNGEIFCLVSIGKAYEIYKLRIKGD
jgi:Tol biopolymer transport system component